FCGIIQIEMVGSDSGLSDIAVKVENLSFCYPGQEKLSLNNVSLTIFKGDRFGLFGPNGAGKTTLMSLMTGLLNYEAGKVWLMGEQLAAHKKELNRYFGFVPQDFSFYQELSPVENLEFFGAWAGLDRKEIKNRSNELLDVLGLCSVRNKQVGKFSG